MNHKRINDLIDRNSHKLTSTEKDIAKFVIDNPEKLSHLTTISNFSEESNFSIGSIVRFCKKLGFEGYSEFKFFIVNNLIEIDVDNTENYLDTLIDIYTKEINHLKNQLNLEDVANLASTIIKSNTIAILGKNSSYIAAQQLQLRLIRNGMSALAISDELTMYNYVDILNKDDLVILFSVSGNASLEYENLIGAFEEKKIPFYLITIDKDSAIWEKAKFKILLPNTLVAKKHLALDGQILFMIFIEILIHKIVLSK